MNITKLKAFIMSVELGSFTKVAKKWDIHSPQSAK